MATLRMVSKLREQLSNVSASALPATLGSTTSKSQNH